MSLNSTGINVISKTDTSKKTNNQSMIDDSSWLKNTFIISDEEAGKNGIYGKWIRKNRYSSTADIKFTCSSPGMGTAINSKPQFTRYADIRSKGTIKSRPDITVGTMGYSLGLGQGRYYSEAIDDPAQRVFFRFGTAQHMNTLIWLVKSFDVNRAVLQNKGVISSAFINAVDIVSKGFMLVAFPLLTITIGVTSLLFDAICQPDRFTSVRDGMFNYWCMVENILNKITVKRTMAPVILTDFKSRTDTTMERETAVDGTLLKGLNDLIPGVVDVSSGRISVLTLALRSQVAFNKILKADLERSKNFDVSTDMTHYPITEEMRHDTYFTNNQGDPTFFNKYMFETAAKTMDFLFGESKGLDDLPATTIAHLDEEGNPLNPIGDSEGDIDEQTQNAVNENVKKRSSDIAGYADYLLGGLTEGLTFAVFEVDSTGSIGESFSNSTKDNPIESIFNGLSSMTRNITDNLNIASGTPLEGLVSAVAGAGSVALSNVTFGLANPLLALAYGATVSLPKQWDSSSVSLPKASYEFKLISPYGNPYSQLFNMYLPYACLLAGAAPRSVGLSTHTAPLYCQVYDRGRVTVNLGIIDNLNAVRGSSTLAFTKRGTPNAIDISLSVTDLHEMLAIDTLGGTLTSRMTNFLNMSESNMDTYISTLTGLDPYHQFYKTPKLRLKLAEKYMSLKTLGDAAYWGGFTSDIIGISGLGKTMLGNNASVLNDLITR